MRVIIAGGRDFNDFNFYKNRQLEKVLSITVKNKFDRGLQTSFTIKEPTGIEITEGTRDITGENGRVINTLKRGIKSLFTEDAKIVVRYLVKDDSKCHEAEFDVQNNRWIVKE